MRMYTSQEGYSEQIPGPIHFFNDPSEWGERSTSDGPFVPTDDFIIFPQEAGAYTSQPQPEPFLSLQAFRQPTKSAHIKPESGRMYLLKPFNHPTYFSKSAHVKPESASVRGFYSFTSQVSLSRFCD
jgi:hypothetical protein